MGDQLGAWATPLFGTHGIGHGLLALVAIPLSVAWLAESLWLGRRQERMAADQAAMVGDLDPAAAR